MRVMSIILKMLKLFFLIIGFVCSDFSVCFLFDLNSIKVLSINDNSSYFGYAVLLQRGNPSFAITGAPRKKQGFVNTGSVFRCNLNTSTCNIFNTESRIRGVYTQNKNGDFLGSVIVGDDTTTGSFFTCAPRFVNRDNRGEYFSNGKCFKFRNLVLTSFSPLNAEKQVSVSTIQEHRVVYYDAAFGEAGFAISYLKDQGSLLTGAPGKSLWMGAMIRTNTFSYRSELFALQDLQFKHQDNYFGYAVTWGRFFINSNRIYYLSGGPRANNLKGGVMFYDQDGRNLRKQLSGEEIGSYFGSSFLVIDNKGKGDDLLVGAPMFSGNSYDEGCVYYYKNKNGEFHNPVKLSNKKIASRFGTTMSTIGDIDLDSFTDCAISAPYEDDGMGAVYIYFGAKTGFSNDNFYRITPVDFAERYPNSVIKGFGMGLSNGNDIDNNKHNDMVIGAYMSGHIFYLKTNPIFDVTMNLTANMKVLYTSTSNFSLTSCIQYSFRNGDRNTKTTFYTRLVLNDDRIVIQKNISKVISIKPYEINCVTEIVLLKKDHLNIQPLIIPYEYKRDESQHSLKENTLIIPVSYECGTDNICQTSLSLKVTTTDRLKITFGVKTEVKVNVIINNSGESAYQTKLYLKVLPEVSLINLRECNFENGSYVCMVAPVLKGEVRKTFLFDLANLKPNSKFLPFNFRVDSLGKDVNLLDNNLQLNIPVILQSSPYIESRAVPDHVFLNKSENILKITHSYLIGNRGPSPFDLNLTILVPQEIVNNTHVIKIESFEGSIDGIDTSCVISEEKSPNLLTLFKFRQENDTKTLSCFNSSENCTHIVCTGGYLPKSNKNAVFTLKLVVNVGATVQLLKHVEKLLFVSGAYYTNGTVPFLSTSATLIFVLFEEYVIPLWIYIASVVVGVTLLLIMIYTLYKCNFFKRTYKKMLADQQSDQNQDNDETQSDEF